MTNHRKLVYESCLKEKTACAVEWIESVILGLELQRAESILLAASPDLVTKLRIWKKRRKAGSSCEAVGMALDSSTNQVMLMPIVIDDREGDDDRSVDAVAIHEAQ
jgi:hypothetical protein